MSLSCFATEVTEDTEIEVFSQLGVPSSLKLRRTGLGPHRSASELARRCEAFVHKSYAHNIS